MKPYRLHPEARTEYLEAAGYYADLQPALGRRFYLEIERLIAEVRRTPGAFRPIRPPARRHFSSHFPYGIIYVERTDDILILAVFHLHRLPGYWEQRIPPSA